MFDVPVTTQKAIFLPNVCVKCPFYDPFYILIKFEHGPCKTIRFGQIVFPSKKKQ